MGKMKNLLMISLDTVRADVGYSRKFRGINYLMDNGVSFSNCIAPAPITPISHASVFTGLNPINHGVRHLFREKIKKNVPLLAETLKKNGYITNAIVSCPGMNSWYGFSKGFDHYDDEIPRLADGTDPLKTVDVKLRGTALKRADLVVEKAMNWMDKHNDAPFFLFLHFFDAHWPYQAPKVYGGDNIYEHEVAYSDHYLEKFILHMKDLGLLDSTTIVCFSDHGEDLGGMYPNDKSGERGRTEEFGHGCLLYDQTQKTILVFNDKSIPKKKVLDIQVRLIDIYPTILDLLDIKSTQKTDGISLIPVINGQYKPELVGYSETFYPEEKKPRGLEKNKISFRINNSYKIILNGSNEKDVELFNLKQDKDELRNLIK